MDDQVQDENAEHLGPTHEDQVQSGIQADGISDGDMAVVEEVEAEGQEAEDYGGDANGLVSEDIQGTHVFLHSLKLCFLLLHQLLHFFFP